MRDASRRPALECHVSRNPPVPVGSALPHSEVRPAAANLSPVPPAESGRMVTA